MSLNFDFQANPVQVIGFLLPVLFIVAAISFLILAVILAYHWRRYGVGRVRASIFMFIYLVTGLVALSGMAWAEKLFN